MSAIIFWAVRLLVLLLIIRLVLRLLYRAQAPASARPAAKTTERIGGALVRDPHCGTYITRERAVTTGSGSATQYFCSTECRDAYRIKASA